MKTDLQKIRLFDQFRFHDEMKRNTYCFLAGFWGVVESRVYDET